MARIVRTREAEADLEEILEYLDEHSPEAADRFARVFKEKTTALSQMPEMGRSREELAPRLRSFNAENYLIFYRPTPDGIEVVRVAHGARNLPDLFDT
ncbi:MAG: type II toxin-antitoxin system RelE/ParE family toxin [Isosphaeraceae bacterium]